MFGVWCLLRIVVGAYLSLIVDCVILGDSLLVVGCWLLVVGCWL